MRLHDRLRRRDGGRGDGRLPRRHVVTAHLHPVDPGDVTVVDIDRERGRRHRRRAGHDESAAHENAQPSGRGRATARNDGNRDRVAITNRRGHGQAPTRVIRIGAPVGHGRRGFVRAQAVAPGAAIVEVADCRRLHRPDRQKQPQPQPAEYFEFHNLHRCTT